MNFLPGWFPGALSSSAALTTVSFLTSATSQSNKVIVPSTVQAGDLLILGDYIIDKGVLDDFTPSGFTHIVATQNAGINNLRCSYRIATASDADAEIEGMTANFFSALKILLVFRGDSPIKFVNVRSVNQQATSGNPSSQTITSGDGSPPLIAIGAYASTGTVNPRTMTPAKDGEVNSDSSFYLAYKIYNLLPANVSVDMGDGGFNILQSFYLELS